MIDIADRAERRRRTEHPQLRGQTVTAVTRGGQTVWVPEDDLQCESDGQPAGITSDAWIISDRAVDLEEVC
ncbi:hypothetical protein ACFQL1_01680 [Halomicroarcula sp. GCM10025709]|uniref:hypothetical protein n=1 Tax=Haloarcula TaxID=2237 RepID=UPI0024C32852|nr:hypothetical protein [Halomicroarcula sp. YJ-61-S]